MAEEVVETSQAQIIYVVAALPNNLKEAYAAKPAMVLGVVQITCAVLSLALGLIDNIGIDVAVVEIGCAAFFFFSGVITLAGARTGTKCLVITTMVLSIISAVCGSFLACLGIMHLVHDMGHCQEITDLVGDMEMDTPYFINSNRTYTSDEKYDETLCDQTRPETGSQWDQINGTWIGRHHPCFVLICSSLQLTKFSLLLLCSLSAMVACMAIAGLTCRVTCCYTYPPGTQASVVYNKSQSYEGEVGKYMEL